MSEHPMVAVPSAMCTVLQETARLLLTQAPPTTKSLPVNQITVGRVLAQDVVMPEPGYPPYRASVMDGYAVRTSDHNDRSDSQYRIIDKIFAGSEAGEMSHSSTPRDLPPAYYVTTGAPVPESFDCVVPVEDCQVQGSIVTITIATEPNKWIRPIGVDIPPHTLILLRHSKVDAVALGLLLQSGWSHVEVVCPIQVGILSTGNELIGNDDDAGVQRRTGQIPDVNRPILLALLSSWGTCACVNFGIARDDDVDAMTNILQSALETCQVIITSGGISTGETDIVEHVLCHRLVAVLHFGRLHMKPGKPTTFATVSTPKGTRLVFAMPGNPVSATVCTHLLVRPCLDLLFFGGVDTSSGDVGGDSVDEWIRRAVDNAKVHPEVEAILQQDVKLDVERPEYHRVSLSFVDGVHQAHSTGIQQSSRLMSLRDAHALLLLPQGTQQKPKALAGERYTALILNETEHSPQIRVAQSRHLNPPIIIATSRVFRVGIVRVGAWEESVSWRVAQALSGSKSGSVAVDSERTYTGPACGLYDFLRSESSVDMHIVLCRQMGGKLRYQLELSAQLRGRLSKVADAMALQARRGAASQDPHTALFEVVVGFLSDSRGSMVILLPEDGLDDGLANVRGLLKHALEIARGGQEQHGQPHG